MFFTYREGVDKQYLSSLHQQPLYTSNYTTNALCARADGVILQEKCQDYLPLIVIWQLRDLWFESDLYLSWAVSSDPSGYWAHTEGCGVFCGSVLTIYCTNVAICSDQKSTVCMLFPSQWTHLAFPADHPIGRFWLSKITFWVDYMLSAASPNYSPVLRWPASSQRNGVASKHARCKHGDRGDRGQQNAQLHGFLQQPFNKTEKQQNIPFVEHHQCSKELRMRKHRSIDLCTCKNAKRSALIKK